MQQQKIPYSIASSSGMAAVSAWQTPFAALPSMRNLAPEVIG
jgi:hypothetical protein